MILFMRFVNRRKQLQSRNYSVFRPDFISNCADEYYIRIMMHFYDTTLYFVFKAINLFSNTE